MCDLRERITCSTSLFMHRLQCDPWWMHHPHRLRQTAYPWSIICIFHQFRNTSIPAQPDRVNFTATCPVRAVSHDALAELRLITSAYGRRLSFVSRPTRDPFRTRLSTIQPPNYEPPTAGIATWRACRLLTAPQRARKSLTAVSRSEKFAASRFAFNLKYFIFFSAAYIK